MIGLSFYGLLLAMMFFIYRSARTWRSRKIVIGAVALPLMFMLALAEIRRNEDSERRNSCSEHDKGQGRRGRMNRRARMAHSVLCHRRYSARPDGLGDARYPALRALSRALWRRDQRDSCLRAAHYRRRDRSELRFPRQSDTLGEESILFLSVIGLGTLLRKQKKEKKSDDASATNWRTDRRRSRAMP